ncbi:hypothetical protein Trydic_g11883 [Trypoxylus dichotomus]
MNAFLKSVKARGNDRNSHIKKTITTQLSETVKEIQLCGIEENILSDSLDVEEATNSLCCVVEAIFLHGLKDSLTLRFRKVIADVDDRPDPNFWSPLLVISHKEIINQITDAAQINTEVGYCRAWIRIILNDCLLSSYLLTLRQDLNLLKSFYHTYAYIRDSDLLEVAQKIIEGLEAVKTFTIPCFSSILNTWPQTTLALAGVWSPTLRMCPVQTCIDVAQSSQPASIGNSETASLGSMMSLHSRSSGIGNILAFNEDEAFKIILRKKLTEDITSIPDSQEHSASELSDQDQKVGESEVTGVVSQREYGGGNEQRNTIQTTLGNSLNRRMGWSFDESHHEEVEKSETSSPREKEISPVDENSKSLEHSYNALIQSYSMLGGTYVKTPDVKGVWEKLEGKDAVNETSSNISSDNQEENVLPLEVSNESSKYSLLNQKLLTIAREIGLDQQNYECSSCKTPITVYKSAKGITNPANVCFFTGEYFCNDCMCETPIIIPARIIHNWDYREYRVSQRAYNYIEEIKDHPMIDLKIVNPLIYSAAEEMSKL